VSTYTIDQEPAPFTPGFNDNNFVVTSSLTASTNYQFIAVIYNAADNSVIAKLKRPVEAGTTHGWFKIDRIIEAYLSYKFGYNDIVSAVNAGAWFQYYIKFGEEYGSTVTEYLNIIQSTTIYTWNACLKSYEFPAFVYGDWRYDNASATKGKFLTPIRSGYPTALTQNGDVWFLQKTTAPPDRVKVIAYDSAGSTTTSVFTTGLTSNVAANNLIRIPAHPTNLNGIASLTSGTPGSVIPATTVRYTVQMYNGTTALGEALEFKVSCESNFTTPIFIYWLNRYGGFDSFIFDGKNEFESSADRKTYDKNPRTLVSTAYGYAASDAGRKVYHTNVGEKVKFKTRFLNPTEAELLDHLATSPVIYMLKGGIITAMVNTGNSHMKRTGEEFAPFQYDFEFEYALADKVQRF